MKPLLPAVCWIACHIVAPPAWAQAADPAPEVPVDPAPAPTDEEDGKPAIPPPSPAEALQPEVIAPAPTLTMSADERATYTALVASLQASLAKATASIAAARVGVDDANQRRGVARLDVNARRAELTTAKAQHKVEVLADSGAAERAAHQAVLGATEAVRAAKIMVRVRTEEIDVAVAELALAKGVAELEKAKLEEAKARTVDPPLPVADLLKLEKGRVLAQTSVARLRTRLADAQAGVERVRP
jgi:hypothetical protein